MICHPGTLSINKPNAGWPQAALLLWLMICACCCEKPKGAIGSLRRPSLIVEPCNRRPKVATMRVMMEPRDARAVKCMQPSIRLPNLLSLLVTPANEQDRAQVGELAQAVQEATGQSVEIAFVDAGYTGDAPAEAAKEHGIRLEVVKLPEAKRGFVPAFATMGGRTLLRLDDTLPTPGARL